MRIRNKYYFKKINTLLFSLFIGTVVTSCYAGVEDRTTTSNLQLVWYPGLMLDKMLKQTLPTKTRQDIGDLLKAEWYDSFELVNPKSASNRKSVKTCLEFFKAAENKLEPVNPRDAIPYMELGMMCYAANAVYTGKNASKTYYGDFKFDKSIVDTFPPDLANIVSVEDRKKILANKKITSWSQAGKIQSIKIVNEKKAIIRGKGESQEIELIAKGDFNNDSIVDFIVLLRNNVDEGSFGSVELFVLTKVEGSKKYKLVKEFKAF